MSSGLLASPPGTPDADGTTVEGRASGRPLEPLIAEYSAIYGPSWKPVTARQYRDDFERYLDWLRATGRPVTTTSFDFLTLAAFVSELRTRPKISGVWRGSADAREQSHAIGQTETLSANTVNSYVRPLRSLAIWLVDEGVLGTNPFRRSRRRAALNPLLPWEETPTKSATLADFQALERGCTGSTPLDLRDRAIVAVLMTTAARNSSVRLLRCDDIDFARDHIRVRRAKGGKTLEVALHPSARAAIADYLADGRSALASDDDPNGFLFPSRANRDAPLSMNALSLMLTRRYRAGHGTLPYFGSHRIRHATATFLVNNGMPLEEVARYLGHSSTLTTRRYAQQTPDSLGRRAADALARAGVG
jgi:site-specific recombinase XerD